MPRRELSKCRKWERERRDRLNSSFKNLSQILPSYDPCVKLSKGEILQRAKYYIEELQNKNRQLQLGNVTKEDKQNEIQVLEERIGKLLIRVEQLAKLLRDAGITVPSDLDTTTKFSRPKVWTNKITHEQTEIIAERIRNLKNGEKLIVQKSSISVKKREQLQNSKVKARKILTNSKPQNENIKNDEPQNCNKQKVEKSNQPTTSNHTNCTTSLPLTNSNSVNKTKKTVQNCTSVSQTSIMAGNMNFSSRTPLVKTSSLLSTPIMATGINNHSSLSSLGPGTLILANGNTIQIQPAIISTVVSPPPNPTLLLIDNNPKLQTPLNKNLQPPLIFNNKLGTQISSSSSKNVVFEFPKIVPKLDSTRTTTVNKIPIPIPALSSNVQKFSKNINNKSKRIVKKASSKIKSKENRKISLLKIKTIRLTNKKSKKILTSSVAKIRKIEKVREQTETPDTSKSEANSNNLKSNTVDTIKIVENKTEEDTHKKSSTNSYSVDSLCNSTSVENKDLQKENRETNSKENEPKVKHTELQIVTSDEAPPPDKNNQVQVTVDVNKEQIEENNANKNITVETCKHQENKENKEDDSLKTNELKQLNQETKGEPFTKPNTIETKATCNVTNKESEIIPEKTTTASTSNTKSVVVDSTPISLSNSVSLEPVKSTDISLSLNLPNTDFSNDIFASLHVPHGSQPESISPTAAFLLAFPLVSTLPGGKIPENVDDETSDSQHGTPTLLQIGNIEGGNNKQSDTSTSQLLDNIPNLFSNKEFSQNECNINKSSRHSLKKQPESKCMDFIQNDCTENKCRTSKETTNATKSTTKEKVTSTSFDLLNTTNCLFSEIPLFPNSSVPSNIFNYEHIPVTYSMPKLPEMFPLCNTNNPKENDGTIFKKDVKHKNDVVLPLPNLTFTPSEFLPASSNNYSLEKLSHSSVISSSGSNNITSINNNKTTVQATSMSVPNSQQGNSSSEYNDKINNFNKKQNSEYNVTKSTNDICKLNQNWKSNSNNESLCQNVFNAGYSISTAEFKQPSTRSNNEKSNEKSYSHLSTSNTFNKINYTNIIDKNIDKNTSQKPPVNWMTTPDSRSKLDNVLTSDGKKDITKNYQNISYSKSNFSIDNTEKVFNTEPYYQNIDPINFNVDKKPVVNHNFTPIFSSSNYSARSQNNNNNGQYSWPSSTKLSTLNDNLHLGLQTPSTLPMLVGDLALNTTSNQGKYENKDFECEKKVLSAKEHFVTKNIDKYKSKHCPETQTNNSFFSVSQLVEHNKHDQTAVRTQTNNQRKSIPQNRSTKINSIQRHSKRMSKPNDEITSKSHSNTNENFSCAKTSTQCSTENKQLIFQDLPTFSLPQLELYENSNVSRDIDWAKPTQETSFMNKNTYKNCSSTYSAEALIGHNIQNNNFQKSTVYSTNAQQYVPSAPKRMQMGTVQPYEAIGAPFYSTPVPETTYVTNYYSQSSNTFTYTTSNTLYQPSSLMTSSANFINTSSLIPDIETDFTNSQTLNVSESTSSNLDISSTNRQTHCSKSKTDGRTTANTLQNKNQSSTYSNHTKRSVMKRKQSTAEPINNLPGFSDLGFLSLSSMNSPMLTDDPFHSHANYFSANTSQMYTGSSQNPMYTKRINQQNHEYSSCNLLPSLPSAPFTRSNILPHTQNAVASPSNSGGNALTNFNLSTIFPEINKPFVSGLYDNSALRSGNNLSTTSSQQTYTDYTNV